MLNKKTIIIIILAVVIFFASFYLVFFLVKRTGNKAVVNKVSFDVIIAELKNNHPEFSGAQLEFYKDAATRGSVEPCQGRADESACVSSVAFIKSNANFCHDLEDKSNSEYIGCVGAVIRQTVSAEIGRCALLSGDDYYNCLMTVLTVENQPLACASFPDAEARATCQDVLNYQAAFLSYNRELCKTVKTEKLNQYCLGVIIDKNQDTDGDGLTDLDEINKYKTHYMFADTDGDGINDGEAVRRGLIKAK